MIKNRKHLIIIVAIVAGLLLAGYILLSMRFRLVSSVPNRTGVVATSTAAFKLTFNRELEKKDYLNTEETQNNTTPIQRIDIEDNTMLVFVESLTEGQEYTFAIANITSTKNERLDGITFDFVAKYIPYDELSKEQQALQMAVMDSSSVEDPIIGILPHDTLDYQMNVRHETDHVGDYQLVVDLQILLSQADLNIDRQAAINTYKEAAFEYIRQNGLNPDDYLIKTSVIEP